MALNCRRGIFILLLVLLAQLSGQSQDLLSLVEDEPAAKEFVTNSFKSTRIINTHSAEFLGAGVLDVRILHRFGLVSGGIKNLYGLDQANMRLGFDYGITKRLMIGVGRSNVNKELDGFVKYRLLWQADGASGSPISISIVAGGTLNTMPEDTSRVNFFTSRMAYYGQALISRKFSDDFSLQLTPSVVHYNLVEKASDANDIFSVGLGGRYKLSKRLAINWDYQYVLPGFLPSGYYNYLGLGLDVETGGHVFQLHFANSIGMNERAFITRTTEQLSKMNIRFGFNLSRVFTLREKH